MPMTITAAYSGRLCPENDRANCLPHALNRPLKNPSPSPRWVASQFKPLPLVGSLPIQAPPPCGKLPNSSPSPLWGASQLKPLPLVGSFPTQAPPPCGEGLGEGAVSPHRGKRGFQRPVKQTGLIRGLDAPARQPAVQDKAGRVPALAWPKILGKYF